jgi:hypothetical protein
MRALDVLPGSRELRQLAGQTGDERLADSVRTQLRNSSGHRTGSLTRGNQRVLVMAKGLQKTACGFRSDKMRGVNGADRRIDNLSCVGA